MKEGRELQIIDDAAMRSERESKHRLMRWICKLARED